MYHAQKREDVENLTKGYLENEIAFYERVCVNKPSQSLIIILLNLLPILGCFTSTPGAKAI